MLIFIPAAILAALIAPELFLLEEAGIGTVLNTAALAGGTAYLPLGEMNPDGFGDASS